MRVPVERPKKNRWPILPLAFALFIAVLVGGTAAFGGMATAPPRPALVEPGEPIDQGLFEVRVLKAQFHSPKPWQHDKPGDVVDVSLEITNASSRTEGAGRWMNSVIIRDPKGAPMGTDKYGQQLRKLDTTKTSWGIRGAAVMANGEARKGDQLHPGVTERIILRLTPQAGSAPPKQVSVELGAWDQVDDTAPSEHGWKIVKQDGSHKNDDALTKDRRDVWHDGRIFSLVTLPVEGV